MHTHYPAIKDQYSHAGTSQFERLLAALAPSYFKMDDRTIKDILAATHRYAKLLNFVKDDHTLDGDWTCLWEVETLTFLAVLSTIDTDAVGSDFATLEKEAKEGLDSIKEGYVKAILFLLQQAERINHYYHTLPSALPFKKEIYHLIKIDDDTDADQLVGTLTTLISYHKEAFQEVNEGESLNHETYSLFLGDLWGVKDENTFYEISSSTDYRMDDWENLRQLAKTFQQAMLRIKHRANYWFDKNLANPQLHQPHVALYLAFLRLFEHARAEMNNLTSRHLEFFYEQILHLRRRAAEPDDVHLLFQLANNVDQYFVKGGTTLLAGKQNGKNLLFETIEDWVFNKAQVAEIKNTYLDIHSELADQARMYASPDVKKVYKDNVEVSNEKSISWRSMGDDSGLPFGEIGFAIASPQLILREGKREIKIAIELAAKIELEKEDGSSLELSPNNFRLYLSTEEEWLEPLPNSNNNKFGYQLISSTANNKIEFRIFLDQDTPPVVQFSEELQKETGFFTSWPIFKCGLNHEFLATDDSAISYLTLFEIMRCIEIKNITIGVDVEDIQENLIIQSDLGVFDGLQKFFPFGPTPEIGAHFYVGSTEIFQKALDTLKVCFDWIDPPTNFTDHYANYVGTKEIAAASGGGFELDFGKKLFDVKNPPKLQIGFIDKAKVEFPVLVARSGSFSGTLSGTVTDLEDNVIPGVTVSIVGTSMAASTDLNGKYRLEGVLQNSALTLEVTFNGNFLTAREFVTGRPFETAEIVVGNASQIDFILVPPIQSRPDSTTANPPGGSIKDIFGNPIVNNPKIEAKDSNATPKPIQATVASGGLYSFDKAEWQSLTPPVTIEYTAVGYKPEKLSDIVDFFNIDVLLEPDPIVKKTEGTGALKGSIVIKDGSKIEGVRVKGVLNSSTEVVVFSKTGGAYEFPPLPAGGTFLEIVFEHPDYESVKFNFPSTPLNQLDIRLSKLKPVKQFRNKVEGQVNPSTAAVMVVGKGLTATATGNYSLTSGASIKIFEDDVIEVSTVPPSTLPTKGVIEYYPVRVPLEGYPAININLEAKIQKLDPLTTNDVTI